MVRAGSGSGLSLGSVFSSLFSVCVVRTDAAITREGKKEKRGERREGKEEGKERREKKGKKAKRE